MFLFMWRFSSATPLPCLSQFFLSFACFGQVLCVLVLLVAVVVAADQIISRKLRHGGVRLGCHNRRAMYGSEFSILIPNVCFALLGLRFSPSRFISAIVRFPVVRPLAPMVPPFPHAQILQILLHKCFLCCKDRQYSQQGYNNLFEGRLVGWRGYSTLVARYSWFSQCLLFSYFSLEVSIIFGFI